MEVLRAAILANVAAGVVRALYWHKSVRDKITFRTMNKGHRRVGRKYK